MAAHSRRWKVISQLAVSALLVAGLFWWIHRQNESLFARLISEPKRWDMLVAAFVTGLLAVVATMIRWFVLVRALDIPFRITDALRLGFLGYFCNFFAFSSVGGDVFKAVFIAREQPQRRLEVIATIVVDRVIGVYALLLFCASVIVLARPALLQTADVSAFCDGVLFLTVVATIGSLGALFAAPWLVRRLEPLQRVPKIGNLILRAIQSLSLYRSRPVMLLVALLLSLGVHLGLSVCIFLGSRGLPGTSPGAAAHGVIVPLANLVGAVPLTLNGIGALEGALEFLYQRASTPSRPIEPGQGTLVALVYRLMTVLIALCGAWYYISAKRSAARDVIDLKDSTGDAGATTSDRTGSDPGPTDRSESVRATV